MIKEIEDLAKAIDLGQQMAEILKKSQLSLFGDPHHVGYERTNASGTMSHIQAKNPRVEAHGVKGMKSTPWRKEFKSQGHFEKWLDKNEGDVTVHATRNIEDWVPKQTDEQAGAKLADEQATLGQKHIGDPKGLINAIVKREYGNLEYTQGNGVKAALELTVKHDENMVTIGYKKETASRGEVVSIGGSPTMTGLTIQRQREAFDRLAPGLLGEIKNSGIRIEDSAIENGTIFFVSDDMIPKKDGQSDREQHVAKLVTMTHEAVAKIAADPKMTEYKPFIDRKLEALKVNPTAKAAHDVLSDVKMMVEKASEPKAGKTEAEASEHLQQVSNRYVKRMHSKLEKFSHADSDDARNGHPPHIPAKEVEGTEARHHTMGEVYGTHPRTYKGEIVPGGTSFSKEFMEKQEANGHKSFILKHTNGNRYLVDSQGYDYARYISKIKEEPKDAEQVTVETVNQAGHKIPKPPTPQTGIPTSRVTVEHMEYLMAHGHDPKGKGTWMFSRHRKIDFAKHKAGEDYITTPSMNYAEAKKHAKQWAASKGDSLIWTMP